MTTEFWSFILAFVIAPAATLAIAYVAVLLHERSAEDHPAE